MAACTTNNLRSISEADPKDRNVTPISVAVQLNKFELLDILMEHSTQLTIIINDREFTLLAKLLTRRSTEALERALNIVHKAWKVLGRDTKELKIYVNKSLEDGSTPLSRATDAGHGQLIEALLESGANPFARILEKKKKTTVLHVVLEKG